MNAMACSELLLASEAVAFGRGASRRRASRRRSVPPRDRERLKAMQMEYQKALNEKEKREYESKRADDARYSDGGKLEILQRSAKIIQLAWRRHVERKEKDSHKGGGGKKKSSKH